MDAIYKYEKHLPEQPATVVSIGKTGSTVKNVMMGENTQAACAYQSENYINDQEHIDVELSALESNICQPKNYLKLNSVTRLIKDEFKATESCLRDGVQTTVDGDVYAELNVALYSANGYTQSAFQVTDASSGAFVSNSTQPAPSSDSPVASFLSAEYINGTFTNSSFPIDYGNQFFAITQLDPSSPDHHEHRPDSCRHNHGLRCYRNRNRNRYRYRYRNRNRDRHHHHVHHLDYQPPSYIEASITFFNKTTVCTVANSNFAIVTSPKLPWSQLSTGCAALGKVPADINIYNFIEAVNTVYKCLGSNSFALIGSHWKNDYNKTPLALYTASSLGGGSINPIVDSLGQYAYMCQ